MSILLKYILDLEINLLVFTSRAYTSCDIDTSILSNGCIAIEGKLYMM